MAARKIKSSSSSSMVSSYSIALGSREYLIDESSLNKKDMISELPNYILYHILSFLPTKDAVKTSILATNWRYLWTFLSFFHFQMLSERETLQHRNNVGDFSSLSKLSLQLSKTTLSIPNGIQFPSLHTLILSYATFTTAENSFQQFLSRCPLLQNLTLNFCYLFFYFNNITISSSTLKNLEIYIDSCSLNCHISSKYSVAIDAVNLLYLTCKSHPSINFRIVKSLTSLLAAYIAFSSPLPRQFGKYVSPCPLWLLRALASVKFLTLSKQTFWDAIFGSDSLHFLPEFHNLTHLCVDLNTFAISNTVLMKFLLRCPILEVLVIPLACTNFFSANEDLSTLVPPCFKSSLKILHISNFDRIAIKFIQFLLENAILLEEIQITCPKLI